MGLASVTLGLSTEAHEEQRELGIASFYWGGRVEDTLLRAVTEG